MYPKQNGSMLVIALFVIIVLAMLAGALINIVSNSTSSVVTDVLGTRTQQAAKAGIETLLAQTFPIGSTPQACPMAAVDSPASFSNISGFNGCSYSARCTSQDITYLGVNYRYYQYSSTGTCDLDGSVISRTLSVDAMEEL